MDGTEVWPKLVISEETRKKILISISINLGDRRNNVVSRFKFGKRRYNIFHTSFSTIQPEEEFRSYIKTCNFISGFRCGVSTLPEVRNNKRKEAVLYLL
jgi:hypothetical protein